MVQGSRQWLILLHGPVSHRAGRLVRREPEVGHAAAVESEQHANLGSIGRDGVTRDRQVFHRKRGHADPTSRDTS